MKIPLKLGKQYGQKARWKESLPFVENKMAILIHRPKKVNLHKCGDRRPHISVEHYCGNTHSGDFDKLTFLEAPNENDLVCHACESRAVMAGLPSSSEIAGRHVHIGKLKAVKTCNCK
jgi:hypothetical protein